MITLVAKVVHLRIKEKILGHGKVISTISSLFCEKVKKQVKFERKKLKKSVDRSI